MSGLTDVKAIVRTECVPDLLSALQQTCVTRFYLSRVHAVGAGVDPTDMRVSLDEGGVYTEKTKIEFVCSCDRTEELVEVIREWSRTGHRGDGVVIVSEVTDLINVRTGDHNRTALL